ncbi:MAG: 50S ribosomal protein L14 [Nanoarchaeota archaeon]|nr:50S ribosomal protein L14 [Nanoarchaeota archaeon]
MKAVKSKTTRALPTQALVPTCDNSGAKLLKVFGVKGLTTTKGRQPAAGVGDIVLASVKRGRPDMVKKVVFAVIVRQKKEFRRADGTRIKFEDNAAVVLKDIKGNPKGTLIKGPVAREACSRFPGVSKLAKIVV